MITLSCRPRANVSRLHRSPGSLWLTGAARPAPRDRRDRYDRNGWRDTSDASDTCGACWSTELNRASACAGGRQSHGGANVGEQQQQDGGGGSSIGGGGAGSNSRTGRRGSSSGRQQRATAARQQVGATWRHASRVERHLGRGEALGRGVALGARHTQRLFPAERRGRWRLPLSPISIAAVTGAAGSSGTSQGRRMAHAAAHELISSFRARCRSMVGLLASDSLGCAYRRVR